MNMGQFRAIITAFFLFFGFLEMYGADAKGYKIVLASFGTFEEAKGKLNDLSKQIEDDEKKLQHQYGFEIVARPSGKAFMLAIEPIEREEDAKVVLKGFKRLYPDGYINGYFGPTEGTVFLKVESLKEEANQTLEANTSNVPEVMNVVQSPEPADVSIAPIKEDPHRMVWVVIGVFGIVALGLIGWFLQRKKTDKPQKGFKEKYEEALAEESEDRVEVIESEAFNVCEEIEDKTEAELKQLIPERDIFDKLKKNSFFITLLGELKSAAETKDHVRCLDVMAELMRYQKNFKKSSKMSMFQRLIETKEFESLAIRINNEIEIGKV